MEDNTYMYIFDFYDFVYSLVTEYLKNIFFRCHLMTIGNLLSAIRNCNGFVIVHIDIFSLSLSVFHTFWISRSSFFVFVFHRCFPFVLFSLLITITTSINNLVKYVRSLVPFFLIFFFFLVNYFNTKL